MPRLPTPSPLDTSFAKALSHPIRVRALAILQRRDASPSEIARELGVPIVNVSHHIGVLRKLGRIEQVAVRHVRGAIEHRYRIVRQITLTPASVAELPEDAVRAIAAHAATAALSDIRDAVNGDRFYQRADNHLSWTPLELDEQGWRRLHRILDDLLEQVLAEEDRARARLADGQSGGPPVRSRLAVFHYEAPEQGDEGA